MLCVLCKRMRGLHLCYPPSQPLIHLSPLPTHPPPPAYPAEVPSQELLERLRAEGYQPPPLPVPNLG